MKNKLDRFRDKTHEVMNNGKKGIGINSLPTQEEWDRQQEVRKQKKQSENRGNQKSD